MRCARRPALALPGPLPLLPKGHAGPRIGADTGGRTATRTGTDPANHGSFRRRRAGLLDCSLTPRDRAHVTAGIPTNPLNRRRRGPAAGARKDLNRIPVSPAISIGPAYHH